MEFLCCIELHYALCGLCSGSDVKASIFTCLSDCVKYRTTLQSDLVAVDILLCYYQHYLNNT